MSETDKEFVKSFVSNYSKDLCWRYGADVAARLLALALRGTETQEDFQTGVDKWMDVCFGETIKRDKVERADRFIEEALELCQTVPGFGVERAHALVSYVFNRPQGDINQEVGGVMVTLAAFCNTNNVRMDEAALTELRRVWTRVEQIRAKQAAKPTGSALPIPLTALGEPKP